METQFDMPVEISAAETQRLIENTRERLEAKVAVVIAKKLDKKEIQKISFNSRRELLKTRAVVVALVVVFIIFVLVCGVSIARKSLP